MEVCALRWRCRKPLFRAIASAACVLVAAGSNGLIVSDAAAQEQIQLPSNVEDFFEPGTQEQTLTTELLWPSSCRVCHEFEDDYDGNDTDLVSPSLNWNTSMMAQAVRDPIWRAGLAIANQDANDAGDTCIRCHSPNAWLGGRSQPTDGSAMFGGDIEGIHCNFCHRLVDPVAAIENPAEDVNILQALIKDGLLPAKPGNARYVVDPDDVRRGPLDDVPANYHGVPIIVSPFHRSGDLCGTCHDVSNAMFTRQGDGTYALNDFNSAHPTGDPDDMMPEQRTYSEWKNSTFASTGVYFPDQRFGGNHPTFVMQSCQDCHMPKLEGGVCSFWNEEPFFPRPDVPQHGFAGANTWVIQAVFDAYGQSETGMDQTRVDMAHARVENMLRAASDMELQQRGDALQVRVVNYSGHKLPTGYPEGRRMWLNVVFYDGESNSIGEYGKYDPDTALLSRAGTKVYEARFGIDAAVAKATGLSEGPTSHLALNNVRIKDNRIPPIGFTNSAFKAVQAEPIDAAYADGQYWDDTEFKIPPGAAQAVVTLNYQTTSKEYIEFLRDSNATNSDGQAAYDLWESHGKSAPVAMDSVAIGLAPLRPGDADHNGVVDIDDLFAVINGWGDCPPPDLCASDVDGNGVTDIDDLFLVINNWG